ncbi:cytosine permease [Homoserinibacter sp. GY 40078]|uniref:purine-cytosine permease family protein n=1 Tax=Homoserinibacter sp. GY 40078 TaxID=2603275 RepID=UPI0011CBCDAD|nr:cytosine permease [Homoserinibacter sp. GY 40078]TXK17450.1 hypothetical protein FVQ89_11515 [Homoserinibacter sp. GY 40078]
MTDVPSSGAEHPPGEDPDAGTSRPGIPPFARGSYPAPFGNDARTSDDELAAALAAQAAMYTGPISLPVVNEEPAMRPNPADAVVGMPPPASLPPVPVPPPPAPAEYVAPDDIAADPEPGAPATGVGLGDDELSRTVENEAASSSTLDAILLLENELRRRQGLAPVSPSDEPPLSAGAAISQSEAFRSPVSAPPVTASPAVSAEESGPSTDEGRIPGWTPAPDPEREGMSGDDPSADIYAQPLVVAGDEFHDEAVPAAPTEADDLLDDAPWRSAPPPVFEPTPLVEPEAAATGALPTGAPVVADPPNHPIGTGEQVDVSTLPPPSPDTAVGQVPPTSLDTPASPVDLQDAPPPVVPAMPLAPPVVDASDASDAAETADDVAHDAPPPAEPISDAGAGGASTVEDSDDTLSVETAGAEPTPIEQRAGVAARMFWMWFAPNSSFVMIAVGATLVTLGMSLRQVLVAIVVGVGFSALPLGLGTLAGRWSGLPTMVISRATFGVRGNLVPALLAVLGRVFWAAVMLWLLAVAVAGTLDHGEPLAQVTVIVVVAAGTVVAGLVAVVGYGVLYRLQRILTLLAAVLLAVTIAATWERLDLATAIAKDDGSWVLVIGGAALVFSVVGLAWAQSSSDVARYQRPTSSGGANMIWAAVGAMLPALGVLAWGGLLAASDPELAAAFAAAPVSTVLGMAPGWLTVPLLAAAGLGLLSAATLAIYSAGLAVVSTGAKLPRPAAAAVGALAAGVLAATFVGFGTGMGGVLRDLATTLAVPVAAWTGIFAAEMMLRERRFHTPSLLATGGVYASVRWVNVVGLVLVSVVGFGLTSATVSGLDWQGYLFRAIDANEPWMSSDLGVFVALGLGLLLPVVAGIPAIRRQERPLERTPAGGMPTVDALVD